MRTPAIPAALHGAAACVGTLLAAGLLSAGCSARPSSPAETGTTHPITLRQPPTASSGHASPDAVTAAALSAMWSVDTATDSGWRAAQLRAAPYLDPEYLAALRAAPVPVSGDPDWASWKEHRANILVAVHPGADQPPPDTPTLARRQAILTLTATGPGGWHAATRSLTVDVTLKRQSPGAAWRITSVEVVA